VAQADGEAPISLIIFFVSHICHFIFKVFKRLGAFRFTFFQRAFSLKDGVIGASGKPRSALNS
jgi:hypothetical protein